MIDPAAYTILIRRTLIDDEICFEARVSELPDVIAYGDSNEEAYSLAIEAIETTSAIFKEKGKAMPAPKEINDDFSGRITLRAPSSLHRSLSDAAEIENVSLNQYLVGVLSFHSGFCYSRTFPAGYWQSGTMAAAPTVRKSQIKNRLTLVSSQNLDNGSTWPQTG
jgi:predicted HicB family RNase H-like nuclease